MFTHAVSDLPRTAPDKLGSRAGLKVAALLLSLLCPFAAQAQFSANPVIMTLTTADSAAVGVITLKNDGQSERQFRFYLMDFEQDADGGHAFEVAGKNPHSCSKQLSIFPTTAALLPGEQTGIRVTMRPGSGTCWGVVMLEEASRDAQRGIRAGQQIAVKIYGVTPTSTHTGEVGLVTATQDAKGVHVLFEFRNEGQAPLRPQGRVELRSMTGDVLGTATLDAFSTLPAHTRRISVDFSSHLPRGQYLAVPILDFGGDYLVGGQGRFTVP